MGGITKALFGGSSSKSSSGNTAFNQLNTALSPSIGLGTSAMGGFADMLGIGGGGTGAQDAAFQNYLKSTGFEHMINTGSKAITGNAASRGMLQSGSTLKALDDYGQQKGLESTTNYMGMLSELAKLGLSSAQIVSGAGQFSKGSGSSQNGIIPGLFG